MRNWRWYAGACAVVAVLVGIVLPLPGRGPGAAGAATPVHAVPDVHGGVFAIEGKQVPLPPGEWHVAGRAVASIDADHAVISVALVRVSSGEIDAAVLMQTNRLGKEASWGKTGTCERTDLPFARVRYGSDHDGSCAYAAYVVPAIDDVDPAWRQALEHGWQFPAHWLEAAYRISDPRDAIEVRYLFKAPDHPSATAVHSLASWTQDAWYDVGSGFRHRLDDEDGLPDWRHPDAHAVVLPTVGAEQNEVAHLSIKATTYRFFGTLTDMSVNYLWLGSLPSAGGLAIVSATASSVLYFFHEMAWGHFEHAQMAVGELPGVGSEGPVPD